MSASMPLLSRSFVVTSLPEEGLRTTVEANGAERAVLAEAGGLVAIESLSGLFKLRPRPAGQGVSVSGEVVAKVVQTCTVTLEPFESELREPVDLVFMPKAAAEAWARRHGTRPGDEAGLADEDPPELIEDGRIDLGQVTAEFMVLGLDPYPRKPGTEFEGERDGADETPSPFAALARLKKAE
jgi:uncharacterized metal-binding protein YceD (DUF177 family)